MPAHKVSNIANTIYLCYNFIDKQSFLLYEKRAAFRRLVKNQPDKYESALAVSFDTLGDVYSASQQNKIAGMAYKKALEYAEKYMDRDEDCEEIYKKIDR